MTTNTNTATTGHLVAPTTGKDGTIAKATTHRPHGMNAKTKAAPISTSNL